MLITWQALCWAMCMCAQHEEVPQEGGRTVRKQASNLKLQILQRRKPCLTHFLYPKPYASVEWNYVEERTWRRMDKTMVEQFIHITDESLNESIFELKGRHAMKISQVSNLGNWEWDGGEMNRRGFLTFRNFVILILVLVWSSLV